MAQWSPWGGWHRAASGFFAGGLVTGHGGVCACSTSFCAASRSGWWKGLTRGTAACYCLRTFLNSFRQKEIRAMHSLWWIWPCPSQLRPRVTPYDDLMRPLAARKTCAVQRRPPPDASASQTHSFGESAICHCTKRKSMADPDSCFFQATYGYQ